MFEPDKDYRVDVERFQSITVALSLNPQIFQSRSVLGHFFTLL